ncbi:iron ABC transporter permease [bacterium]|nr:iron ABC transporter permease [bacterium]
MIRRLGLIALISIVVVLICPFIGMHAIRPGEIVLSSPVNTNYHIFWDIRLPRVLFAFLAGSGLAMSGMAFQALFRNPLATPFTLGVSSGAAFGAALAINIGLTRSIFNVSGTNLCAFLGALLSIMIVYALSRIGRKFSTATMLLAGVAINFFFSSFILFMQYISDFTHSFRIIRWLMGELGIIGYDAVQTILPFIVLGCLILYLVQNELNLLTIGEDIAASRGVRIDWIKKVIFLITSLMVGGIVSICGPIGFVGIMVPHICRLLVGAHHKQLIPAVFLFGGCFLVLCDTLARTIIAPVEIPVGVITALLGGPFFITLLLKDTLH